MREGLKKHRGAITDIAQKAGVSRQTVYDNLNGKHNNMEVLKIAGEEYAAREAKAAEERKLVLRSIQKGQRLATIAN